MRFLVFVFLLTGFAPAWAQSTEADLQARLLHQPLYLQGQWDADKLHFDSGGKLVGPSQTTSFTLSAIDVDSVALKGGALRIKGRRMGLEFDHNVSKRVELQVRGAMGITHPERIEVTLDAPAGGDFSSALNAVFTDKLEKMVPQMPDFWTGYARLHILGEPPAPKPIVPPSTRRVGGGVTAPKVLSAPEPQYDESARALRYSGTVLVYLQVDKEGKPGHVRILRALGLGLDEQAVAAVRAYKFEPALENGEPVAVEMNVEVNFQIF